MKIIFTLVFTVLSVTSFAQLKPGFETAEVKYTIAMCNSFNFLKQFGTHNDIIPEEFNLVYTSDILSMDNKFEVYENGEVGVINYRGSTDKLISWVENCYSAMIPAEGTIKIDSIAHRYTFAKDPETAVHAGYALTVVLLSDHIIEQVHNLNEKGIRDIVITGHSQGGALATMTRAYLENLENDKIISNINFKTYAYAQPMCGNKEFSEEYNRKFSKKHTSYFITNPDDPVPYLPFNYEEGKLVTKQKLRGWLFGESNFSLKKFGQDAFIRTFERGLTKHIKNSNSLINKLINLKFGNIEMPPFVDDINYYPTGFIKEIPAFNYPEIEVDITNIDEDELNDLEQGIDGKWYKKASSFFQHKPYNYYVHVLKEWDHVAYNKLDKHYLDSDL